MLEELRAFIPALVGLVGAKGECMLHADNYANTGSGAVTHLAPDCCMQHGL